LSFVAVVNHLRRFETLQGHLGYLELEIEKQGPGRYVQFFSAGTANAF